MKTTALGLCGVLGVAVTAACSGNPGNSQAVESWREAISRSPSPDAGCFHVSYPNTSWERVDCGVAPARQYRPRRGAMRTETVGNGNDYAAQSSGLISQTVGSFPTATGVAGERGAGVANDYSIQLNSNFMAGSEACKGVAGCQSWQQFVYASGTQSAFMQSWLIRIGTCPSGGSWMGDGAGDCFMNSPAVNVPLIPSDQLSTLKMSGTAVSGGNDSLVFTAGTDAYSTSESDSFTALAKGWTSSEFNVIGDGDASQAVFGPGASITVNIVITDGTTNAPTCASKAGTTGETNNLTMGSCNATGGSAPSVQFTESDGPSTDSGTSGGTEGGSGATDGGSGGTPDGGGVDDAADSGPGYAFVERHEGRRHGVSLAAGATDSIPFSWHDSQGMAPPADLSVEVDGRTVLQIASVGEHPFARAGLDVGALEADATYRLELGRADDTLTVSVARADGEVVLRTLAHVEGSTSSVTVVLPDASLRNAIVSDAL